MANRYYAKGAEKVLKGQINFEVDDIRVALVSSSYVENLDTDEFYSTVQPYALDQDVSLVGKTVAGGKFDAVDPLWEAVAAGSTVECFVLYKWTGDAATSPLLMRLDQVSSLPFLTNGGDVDPKWDNGANRIFSLVP